MKVSIITPTFDRGGYHASLYASFKRQDHPQKELLVWDDSPVPSPFFTTLDDPEVRYFHSVERYSIGEKRNLLAERADGEVIAHFDDDDYYKSNYLSFMLGALGEHDLIKLGGWFVYSVPHQALFYWDTTCVSPLHFSVDGQRDLEMISVAAASADEQAVWRERNMLGYGFSYVYRKSLWQDIRFAHVSHGEDLDFALRSHAAGAHLSILNDLEGVVLYIRHARDSSRTMPQYQLPPFMLRAIFDEDALALLR